MKELQKQLAALKTHCECLESRIRKLEEQLRRQGPHMTNVERRIA